jgi:hypothetical protein
MVDFPFKSDGYLKWLILSSYGIVKAMNTIPIVEPIKSDKISTLSTVHFLLMSLVSPIILNLLL